MATERNKIAASLTDEELEAFMAELAKLPPGSRPARVIQEMAERHGIVLSVESARTFKRTTFQKHLDRIARRKEKAGHIAAVVGDGSGRTLNEAALGIMAEKIFDELNAEDDNEEIAGELGSSARTPLDADRIGSLALSAARIQKSFGEVDRVKAMNAKLEAELREYKARDEERQSRAAEVEKDTTLSDEEKAVKWRQIFGMA